MFTFLHCSSKFYRTSGNNIHTLCQFNGVYPQPRRPSYKIFQTSFLFTQQTLRDTAVAQWSKYQIQICLRRYVHHNGFKFFTVINGTGYGIIDICDLEKTLQVFGIGLEKTPQPSHVVPLVEQRIQNIILISIISDRPPRAAHLQLYRRKSYPSFFCKDTKSLYKIQLISCICSSWHFFILKVERRATVLSVVRFVPDIVCVFVWDKKIKSSYLIELQRFIFANKWSWRGLNPRPVVDSMSFLHAYSHVSFRVVTGKRRPIATLSSKVSRRLSRLSSPYFRFTCTTWSIRLGKRTIG